MDNHSYTAGVLNIDSSDNFNFEHSMPMTFEMNEEIFLLNEYLPILYRDEAESDYLKILFKAIELTYSNSLYQIAYIQLHMIFMVCIYFILTKINVLLPKEIENALHYMIKDRSRVKNFYGTNNTRDGELYFGSFAYLGESDVFLLLKITDIDSELHGELKKLVEERNKYAHANGNIVISSQTTIDVKISKYIKLLERVQKIAKPKILELYRKTLKDHDFSDPENRTGYFNNDDQIKEYFIKKYSLSIKDIYECSKLNISDLSVEKNFEEINKLHVALIRFYKSLGEEENED